MFLTGQYFQRAEREGRFGVVLIGVAQEKTSAWRGWRDGGPDGHPHFEFSRQTVFVNHFYFYIRDRDWGPGFIKTVAYAPSSTHHSPNWTRTFPTTSRDAHRWPGVGATSNTPSTAGSDRLRSQPDDKLDQSVQLLTT